MGLMSWERLEKIIDWAGMSTHAFAMKIGMKRSENLYRIIRNKENVSIKLSMRILETYPQINRNWLIYGEGDMLVELQDEFELGDKIPYYPTLVETTTSEGEEVKPEFNVYLPMFNDINVAIPVVDRAMDPLIPMGATILMRKPTTDIIMYGNVYYVEVDGYPMVRIIRSCPGADNKVTLEAVNSERYDNIIVEKSKLSNIYIVCGTVNRFV